MRKKSHARPSHDTTSFFLHTCPFHHFIILIIFTIMDSGPLWLIGSRCTASIVLDQMYYDTFNPALWRLLTGFTWPIQNTCQSYVPIFFTWKWVGFSKRLTRVNISECQMLIFKTICLQSSVDLKSLCLQARAKANHLEEPACCL